jgi:hypothetical protein
MEVKVVPVAVIWVGDQTLHHVPVAPNISMKTVSFGVVPECAVTVTPTETVVASLTLNVTTPPVVWAAEDILTKVATT